MAKQQRPRLKSVHRALADPMRLRILEYLWRKSQSAKEIAALVGLPPDRIYYHLAQLEEARLIEVAEYRRLPGGKVERIYRPASVEPPGDEATPQELAAFLGAALEATRADISAASMAKEAGERRDISLTRAVLRLTEAEMIALRDHLLELLRQAHEKPDDEGIWTCVVVTLIDLEDRTPAASKREPGDSPHE